MSRPRERHPGAFYHITRRCHRREMRLSPTPDINGAIGVLVNDACEATQVRTIATCWMGNHYHAVVYDPDGRVSEWTSHVNGTMARFCNAIQDVTGHMWDAQEGNIQELGDLETVAKMTAYVICNPVAAGLVHKPNAYPGVCTTLKMVASNQGPIAKRPTGFFRPRGVVSEVGQITHYCPPGIEPADFVSMVRRLLNPLLEQARAQVEASGKGYVGAKAIKETDPFTTARSHEGTNVGLQAKTVRRMLAATPARTYAMVQRYARFLADYARARWKLVRGIPNDKIMFPAGTWHLWRYAGARRHAPPRITVEAAA